MLTPTPRFADAGAANSAGSEFADGVGGAICRFRGITTYDGHYTEMRRMVAAAAAPISSIEVRAVTPRAGFGAAPLAVHRWTGRSALSLATTTSRPHIATAGARRTRVSEMRLSAARTYPSRKPGNAGTPRITSG